MRLFETKKQIPSKLLKDKYIVPPFSILDGKTYYWMNRKAEWESVLKDRANNIRNDISTGNTPYVNSFSDTEKYPGLQSLGGISTFDPFLTEILIKWFSREGDLIFDPFAGGIVRGAVSVILNRSYLGFDISPKQVEHNKICWEEIKSVYGLKNAPEWVCKDSATIDISKLRKANFLLTCPPYYDLEKYTDIDGDLSKYSTYERFLERYRSIIQTCYDVLDDDSFACIVVEEIRDKDGILRGFVPDTVKAFTDAGFKYYNEMILENRVVSLGVRCPKYFDQSRKVGRHHQNVLVFFKGNPKNIENKFGIFNIN